MHIQPAPLCQFQTYVEVELAHIKDPHHVVLGRLCWYLQNNPHRYVWGRSSNLAISCVPKKEFVVTSMSSLNISVTSEYLLNPETRSN